MAVDVRASPVSDEQALEIVREAGRLIIKNGTKLQEYDLADEIPEDDELRRLVLGRSNTMRAPALQVDDTVMIGYDEDTYLELLGLE